MPYISQELRREVDRIIKKSTNICELKVGLINLSKDPDSILAYLFYWLLVHSYSIGPWTIKAKPLKILSDIDKEYYERVLKPYADKKIKENGDI